MTNRWLAGIPVVVVLILLTAPGTRWVTIQQVGMLCGPLRGLTALAIDEGVDLQLPKAELKADDAAVQRSLRRTAARYRDDYEMQLAWAFEGTSTDAPVKALRALACRFPDQPALWAQILASACIREVRIERPENDWTSTTMSLSANTEPPPSPAQLATFDHAAAEGERLDPNNAFFPLMRSIGLFAAHRDTQALDGIRRAASETKWNDYSQEQVGSIWKLRQAALGERSALPRALAEGCVLFPDLEQLRAVARVATYLAFTDEQKGNAAQGLAIRYAVMRCGSLMRSQSSNGIGSLVGIAIEAMAIARPGGAPMEATSGLTGNERVHRRVQDFLSYLKRTGHSELGTPILKETEAGTEAKSVLRGGSKLLSASIGRVVLSWLISVLVLLAALILALIVITAVGDARTPAWGIGWRALMMIGTGSLCMAIVGWALWSIARSCIVGTAVVASIVELMGGSYMGPPPTFTAYIFVISVFVVAGGALLFAALTGPTSRLARRIATMACVLTLFWGLSVMVTAHDEAAANHTLTEITRHEGPFYAKLKRQQWPGPMTLYK